MVLAEWGTGQVLWSIFWTFLFVLFVVLVITMLVDVFMSDLSGWAKAAWIAFMIFLPFIGVLTYLIVYGNEMSGRSRPSHRRSRSSTISPMTQARLMV